MSYNKIKTLIQKHIESKSLRYNLSYETIEYYYK